MVRAGHQGRRHWWRIGTCGLGKFRINVFVVIGAALHTVAVVMPGWWETSDLSKLGRHLDRRVHDWGKATALSAVLRVVGGLTFLVPIRADRDVLLLLLRCEELSVSSQ